MVATTDFNDLIHAANDLAILHQNLDNALAEIHDLLQEEQNDNGKELTILISKKDQARDARDRAETDFRARFPGFDPLAVAYGSKTA